MSPDRGPGFRALGGPGLRGPGPRALPTALCLCLCLCLCLLPGCAVQNKPPVAREGKVYGATPGWVWRPTWWNYYQRGVSFAQGEVWTEAMDDLERAIDLRPEDARIGRTYGMHFTPYFPHRELGVIYYRLGRYPESVRQLERSLEAVTSAKAEFYLNQARRGLLLESGADLAPPAIEVQWPPAETLTRDLFVAVRGVVRGDGYVAGVSVAGRKVPVFLAEPEVSFSSEVALRPGLNRIRVAARDLAGRETVAERRVQVDRAGPLLFVDAVRAAGPGSGTPVVVSGEARDRHGLRCLEVDGVPLEGVSGGSVRFAEHRVPLPGRGFIEIRAEDLAGNVTWARVEAPSGGAPSGRRGAPPPVRVVGAAPAVLDDRGPAFPWVAADARDPSEAVQEDGAGDAGPALSLADPPPDGRTVFDAGLYVEGRAWGPRALRSLTVAGRQLLEREGNNVYFGYLVKLEEGENRIRVEAVDARGRSAVRTVRVVRRVPAMLRLSERMRLSLLPMRPEACRADRVRLLEEGLRIAFVRQGRFDLVERARLEEVLRERRISAEGLAGPRAAARVGRVAAADGMVMGWATETPGDIEVVTRLIDVETSEILLTVDAYGQDKRPAALEEMMEGLAHRYRQRLPLVEGTVVRCERERCYLDAGADAGLRPGQKLYFFRPGRADRGGHGCCPGDAEMEAVGTGRLQEVLGDVSAANVARQGGAAGPRPADRFVTK